MWKLLLLAPLGYLAILLAIYIAQSSLLFPTSSVAAAGPLPASAKRLVVTHEKEQLHGVHIPPRMPDGERLTILGFGGNAWNAEAAALYLHDLYPHADIAAFHYRGYKPSTGAPSAAALLADAPAIHDHVVAVLKPDRIVAVGLSVGSGVAARLASVRPLHGVILVTPFESLRSVASSHYPWLPVALLFRNEMPAAEDLASSRVPTAVIAAEADTLVIPARTAALRKAARNLVFDRTISGAGHNDIYDRPAFRAAMREALAVLDVMAPPPR